MTILILLYIMICHKTGLGIEWYDWLLLGVTLVANVVEGILRRTIATKVLSDHSPDKDEFYFKDLFNSKEKK